MRKLTKWILIASGVTLGLCLLLGIVASLTGGDKTTDQPTTVLPATIPVTAVAPVPATVASTATVEPSYTDDVLRIMGGYRDALNSIGALFTEAGTDTSLISDEEWRIKMATGLAMLQISSGEVRSLTPPAQYAAAHAELLDLADHMDRMAKLSAQGIDNLDGAKITQANDELNQGSAAMKRVTAAILAAASGTPAAAPTPGRTVSPAKGSTANTGANLRAGPGTTYDKIGSAAVGQALDIVGRNAAGDWYQLRSGAWIAASLVTNPPAAVPLAPVHPTPAAAAPGAVKAAAAIPAVSSNPNAFACIGGCAVAPDPSCAIKGNVNSDQVKIYHTRGQQNYDDTDIKPEEGDLWFCTEAEAQAAGFRHAQR